MSTDGAEGTTTKTPTVYVYREFNHLVGGYALVFIFRMRQTGIGQIIRCVNLFCGHRWVGWVHYSTLLTNVLQDARCMYLVALFLNMSEVVGLRLLVLQTFFVAIQHNIIVGNATWYSIFGAQIYGLGNVANVGNGFAFKHLQTKVAHRLLAHTID